MPHFQVSQSLEEYEAALEQIKPGAVTSVAIEPLLKVLRDRLRKKPASLPVLVLGDFRYCGYDPFLLRVLKTFSDSF
jgi:hypothetical protein